MKISVSTFATRLHKVQDRFLNQLEVGPASSDTIPTFVDLSEVKLISPKQSSATIICGSARIEITEDISEVLLKKLIGAFT